MTAAGLDSFVAANALNLWLAMRTATTVLARTRSAGPPPAGWSSTELVTQHLELVVEETLCGTPPQSSQLALDVSVVEGARSSDPAGGLAGWMTTPGSRLVVLLDGDRLFDEDLGALPATQALVEWIRGACSAPPPPGLGTMLHRLVEAAERDPDVRARFAGIDGAVVDIADPATGDTVRLTVAGGQPRVFTGVRAERVARTRPADARTSMSAADLAALQAGERVDLEIEGDDRGAIAALGSPGARPG
jgi:hypothetical protein